MSATGVHSPMASSLAATTRYQMPYILALFSCNEGCQHNWFVDRDSFTMSRILRQLFSFNTILWGDATLVQLKANIANPVYEREDEVPDRIACDPPTHGGIYCDGSECSATGERKGIHGPRFCCIDCPPNQTDFCSTCVMIPGQGIDHDASHKLVRIRPTCCAVCQNLLRLKLKEGDTFRGPYLEFSAPASTFQRIAQNRSCNFCSFVWNALAQCPVTQPWPPRDEEEVTIRVRKPWDNCLRLSVVATPPPAEDFDIRGNTYARTSAKVSDMESELDVYIEMGKWSLSQLSLRCSSFIEPAHELPVSIAQKHDVEIIARVNKNSSNDEALQLAKMWLQNCRENHPLCADAGSEPGKLPTRVIDLQGPDKSRVYLRETKDLEDEYAALSYCWGPGSPGLFTTQKNFESHRDDGIAITDLPASIRDAIRVTSQLGLRYLWIDRLCILQDSAADWTHQAALMCDVYAGAALTLSADGSKSADDGLFCTKQKFSNFEYQQYQDPWGYQNPFLLHRPQTHRNLEDRASTNYQSIDQRGWTMQERLMSRRVLHFTTDEMVWECNELTECECRRQSQKVPRALAPGRIKDMDSLYDLWRVLVLAYTKRMLSHDMDKLLALRGLVTKFQQMMRSLSSDGTADEYLAGLWRGDLAAQLAWKPPVKADLEAFARATNFKKAAEHTPPTPTENDDWIQILRERNKLEDWHQISLYVAPTWSWAHLHGPVAYLMCYPGPPFKSYVEVLQAETVSRVPGEATGQIVAGSVTLRGFMVRDMSLDIMQCGYEGNIIKDLSVLLYGNDNEYWIEWQPDDAGSIIRERGCDPRDLILLFLGTKDLQLQPNARVEGLSYPYRMERKPKEGESNPSRSEVAALLPQELRDVFVQSDDLIRWPSFLVLAESKRAPGKYERLGCFDIWGDQVDVLAALFVHSEEGEVTII